MASARGELATTTRAAEALGFAQGKLGAMKLLVVEDDDEIAEPMVRGLERAGYAVERVTNGAAALTVYDADLVVLDLGLPDVDGLEVCRRLRARSALPIVVVTARDDEADRVIGLELGADDYLVKPFALRELIARLRALMRRVGDPAEPRLEFADLSLDRVTREVRRADRPIELSRTEFSLLEMFLEHPRHVLTRSQIFERVWGYDFGPTSNSLGVYVGYLRRKLEEEGERRLIHTVRGVGYALREDG